MPYTYDHVRLYVDDVDEILSRVLLIYKCDKLLYLQLH